MSYSTNCQLKAAKFTLHLIELLEDQTLMSHMGDEPVDHTCQLHMLHMYTCYVLVLCYKMCQICTNKKIVEMSGRVDMLQCPVCSTSTRTA